MSNVLAQLSSRRYSIGKDGLNSVMRHRHTPHLVLSLCQYDRHSERSLQCLIRIDNDKKVAEPYFSPIMSSKSACSDLYKSCSECVYGVVKARRVSFTTICAEWQKNMCCKAPTGYLHVYNHLRFMSRCDRFPKP